MTGVRYAYGPTEIDDTGTYIYIIPVERKSRVTKIMIYNPDSADHTLLIGSVNVTSSGPDPTTFSQVLPDIKVLSGDNVVLTEDEIPILKINSTSTSPKAWYVKTGEAITASKVKIAIEFEEN